MAGKLTTHVLDVSAGRPAAGVRIEVWRDGAMVARGVTNADGRCDAPLLAGADVTVGVCELRFAVGDYFALPTPRFLDEVVLRFGIVDADAALHVPLLVTPWSVSSYRGS
jgi:5-hydroxyisourate hydrolase